MSLIYVYIDVLKITNEVIYVGKGTLGRVLNTKRNDKWKNVTTNYEFNRNVIYATRCDDDALNVEKLKILEFHTFVDDPLAGPRACNFTSGGDGKKLSAETKAKIKAKHTGKTLTTEHKTKLRIAKLGKKLSKNTRNKISKGNKGKQVSSITRQKISQALTGRKQMWKQKTRKPVNQFDLEGNLLKTWDGIWEATKHVAGNRGIASNIIAVCRNKRKIAYGFKWKYAQIVTTVM